MKHINARLAILNILIVVLLSFVVVEIARHILWALIPERMSSLTFQDKILLAIFAGLTVRLVGIAVDRTFKMRDQAAGQK